MQQLIYKGTTVSYTDEGKGNTIVLLHGFLENSTMWDAIKPSLLKRNRVVCIDLLGHGKTECLGYVHEMDVMADVVAEVLQYLKIRRSIFVGHSMGGYVSLAFAEMYPDNVKGLCLLNSTTRADSKERIELRSRAIEAVKTNYKNLVRMSISNLFRPKNRKVFQAEIKAVKKEALKTPLQGYIAAQEGMKLRFDREALLHFSPYPKMMILGKKDPVLNYEDLLDQLEGTEVLKVELPDGHMSHIENQQEVIDALQEFVKVC
ncbi:alpha/beta fold hydrolase [Pseudofulvibacter geojedonensis]|uniref:Alpha/beta fold hydrolase n=1 Tax=Pseudofulvibacter geojedonensis TaxID=1123758 RepID=A0ABW3I3R0_9FLAO